MEKLAWIEILNRHGEVSRRHPVLTWPIRLGRAYSNDIVLDDPYVAAHHLEINQAEKGCYQLTGLGSLNGMTINKLHCKNSDATVSTIDVIRLGHTQLRIRPIDFAVDVEKPLKRAAWLRSWPGLIFGSVLLLLAHFLTLWLDYSRDEIYKILVEPLFRDIPLLLAWAGFWALVGRVLCGHANFIAHAVIASLVIAVLLTLDGFLFGYIDFAFNTSLMANVFSDAIIILIIGWLLYRHICLVSRADKFKLGISIAVLSTSLAGISYSIQQWSSDDDLSHMSYSRTIGPPSLLMTQGKSVDEFLQAGSVLKTKLED